MIGVTTKISDYYKLLGGKPGDNDRTLYLKFKHLAESLHRENAKKFDSALFLLTTEGYYLLSYKRWRQLYDRAYKNLILYDPDSSLNEKQSEELQTAIQKSKEFAQSVSDLSFKKYWRKIPKKSSVISNIFNGIMDLFTS
jgi:hypothetical protein